MPGRGKLAMANFHGQDESRSGGEALPCAKEIVTMTLVKDRPKNLLNRAARCCTTLIADPRNGSIWTKEPDRKNHGHGVPENARIRRGTARQMAVSLGRL